MTSCWVKQPDGTEVFDPALFAKALAETRQRVEGAVRGYVKAIEGGTRGEQTIKEKDL